MQVTSASTEGPLLFKGSVHSNCKNVIVRNVTHFLLLVKRIVLVALMISCLLEIPSYTPIQWRELICSAHKNCLVETNLNMLQTQCTDALDNHLSLNFLFLIIINEFHSPLFYWPGG